MAGPSTNFLGLNANGDQQRFVGQQTSFGAAQGQIVALNSANQIDASLLPSFLASYTPGVLTASGPVLIESFSEADLATAAGNIVATLPDATTCSGQMLMLAVSTVSAGYALSLATVSSQTINGTAAAAMPTLSNVGQSFILISDGANWATLSPVTDLAKNVTGILAVLNGPGVISATANATTNITAGAMIYIDSSGKIMLADNTTPAKATGFSPLAITKNTVGKVVIGNGPNNSLSGLTVGSDYFLDAAGAVVVTVPSVDGTLLQKVGTAVTTTQLQVILGMPILL